MSGGRFEGPPLYGGHVSSLIAMTAPLPLIACSLDGDGQHARLADWADLLAQASTREETAHGVRYTFASVTSEAESRIRALASAEQGCCSFLQFKIARADDEITMTVTAPPERREALRFIFSA
jgi:hypothetical protein